MTTRSPEIDGTKLYLLERLETTEQQLQQARRWTSILEWVIRGGIGISVVVVTSLYASQMASFGQTISSVAVAIIGFASQTLDAVRTLRKHVNGGLLNLAEGLVSSFLIAWGVYKFIVVTSSDYRSARITGWATMAFFALLTIFCHKHAGSFDRIVQTVRSQIRRYGTLLRIRSTRF